jgi:DNA-directed RNA polymerase specialized sigma24 family protein
MNQEITWDDVSDVVFKLARIAANRSARIHRNLVSSDDVYQHLVVWALEHEHKLVEWAVDEGLSFKLKRTFNNEAQKLVARERKRHSRIPISDIFFYTTEVLHELLRDVWAHDAWGTTPDMSSEFVSRTTKPDEGNNRLALMSDVYSGIQRLNEADRTLLHDRYAEGGLEFAQLAEKYEASEEAMRKRVQRALRKLQEKLGGEPPVWNGRRRIVSNAQAQVETRQQDEQA